MMNTMLPTLMNREDAPSTHPDRQSSSVPPKGLSQACLIARIGRCHRQVLSALNSTEMEGWWAEEQGLIDALLHRDCTYEYESRPILRERYGIGLADGEALIQTAKVRPSCRHRYRAS